MNKKFYVNLGLNIKKEREKLGLTQQQLADVVGIGLNHLGKIEVAYAKPSLDTVINIATALNVTMSNLCDFSELTNTNLP